MEHFSRINLRKDMPSNIDELCGIALRKLIQNAAKFCAMVNRHPYKSLEWEPGIQFSTSTQQECSIQSKTAPRFQETVTIQRHP